MAAAAEHVRGRGAARRTPRTSTADLVRAAYPAIKAVDPAPRSSSARSRRAAQNPTQQQRPHAAAGLHPLASAASTATLKRDRSRAAARASSRSRGDGFAYHPHAIDAAPDDPAPRPDDAAIADLPRLERTLDAVQRAGGFTTPGGAHFGLHLTEFGYQTLPPDPIEGVPLGPAVALAAAGDLHRLARPARAPLTQYEWRDEPVGRGDGRDEVLGLAVGPALRQRQGQAVAEELRQPVLHRPAAAQPHGPPLGPRASRQRAPVTVQRRRPGAKRWTTVKVLSTNASGFWKLTPDAQGNDRLPLHLAADRRVRCAQRLPLQASDVLRGEGSAKRG